MDKASKWFRSILGPKRRDTHNNNNKPSPSSKRRWSFVITYREKNSSAVTTAANSNATQPREGTNGGGCDDSADHNNNKHDIAVAAATSAVAEGEVAAAQAAAAVIRLTGSSGRCARDTVTHCAREESATVKIQSTFRGYLARRALRALKGLVRLQALVRGYIVRKRSREWLRKMRALLQAQARARAGRVQISEYSRLSSKSSHFHHPGPPTPEKFEYDIQQMSKKYEQSSMLKRNGSKLSGRTLDNYEHIGEESRVQRVHSTRIGPMNDEQNDKILEVASKRRNLFHSTHLALSSDQYSCSFTNSRDSEVQSLNPFKYSNEVEESPFCTADNSPNFYSASSKGGSSKRSPFTPAKSDGSRSYLNSYSDHPNYMSYTESSRAKARSISAPKLRPQQDRSCSRKGYSIYGSSELKSHTLKSVLRAKFASKAYPGSGRLNMLGMPVEYRC